MSFVNFPKKFAVMPIKVIQNHTGEEVVVRYMPDSCYLLNKTTTFCGDGSKYESYEVVFEHSSFILNKRGVQIPMFNGNGECKNSMIINKVYNSMHDAIEESNKLNEKIKDEKTIKIHKLFE